MCAGTHPPKKGAVVVLWGWRNCTFVWKWSSFSAAVGYNPNCCFGELQQSTATRAGVGRNYFEASQCIYLFIYFILNSGGFLSFREENLSNGLHRKMHLYETAMCGWRRIY